MEPAPCAIAFVCQDQISLPVAIAGAGLRWDTLAGGVYVGLYAWLLERRSSVVRRASSSRPLASAGIVHYHGFSLLRRAARLDAQFGDKLAQLLAAVPFDPAFYEVQAKRSAARRLANRRAYARVIRQRVGR